MYPYILKHIVLLSNKLVIVHRNVYLELLRLDNFLVFAFHHNSTIPFYPLHFEIIVKGRPSNNPFYPRSLIADNLWGGMLVGNYCAPAFSSGTRARVIVSTKLFQKTLAR